MREGEFVDIEVDSGAEVRCLLANIGADTHPTARNEAQRGWRSTLRQVAANCMSSAPGSWVWRLQTCDAM